MSSTICTSDKTKAPPGSLDHLGAAVVEKWEVVYREPYGRCIVARQNISEGQILFYDQPIIVGPKLLNSTYLCLGCYRPLLEKNIYHCSRCSWTLCSKDCENKGFHPTECKAFSDSNFKLNLSEFGESNPLYESILPLRCLLTQSDQRKWKIVQSMESHDDLRRVTESWKYEEENVCKFLKCKTQIPLTEEEIHTICGILDVNCHEIRGYDRESDSEYRVRGMYPLCAMMSHDCTPNTHHTIMEDHTMVMVASRDINAGEQITGIYTHLLSGTNARRKHLRCCKYFDCVCKRCSDPSELGSYLSALRCSKNNCNGRVLCKNPCNEDSTRKYACDLCNQHVDIEYVSFLTKNIDNEIRNTSDRDLQKLENILKKYSEVLSPNHHFIVSIKSSLSQMYGRLPGRPMVELNEDELDRKINYCKDVLSVLDILSPGISRLRGLTKYELQVAYLLQVNRSFKQRCLMRSIYKTKLEECLQLLKNSIHCLQFEPDFSFEGKICKVANKSRVELSNWISSVDTIDDTCFLLDLPTTSTFTKENFLSSQNLSLSELLSALE